EATEGKISVRADATVAGASAKGERPLQLRRQRLVRVREWSCHYESSPRRRHAAKERRPAAPLFEGRFLRENPGGRNQIDRSRAQRADVDRGRDNARERSSESGNDE